MSDFKQSRGDFEAFQKSSWPESFLNLRKEAFERYESMQAPSTRMEEWRFTNVAPYLKSPVTPVRRNRNALQSAASIHGPDPESWRIVFIDGEFAKEYSSTPSEFFVGSLEQALLKEPSWEQYLGRVAKTDTLFASWNTAFFYDAGVVGVPDDFVEQKPIQILFLSTGAENTVVFPRVLVVVGKNSQVSVVESYATLASGRNITNAVTEMVLKESAVVQHVKMQQDGDQSLHVAAWNVLQERNSSYLSLSMTIGSGLSREDLIVKLDGTGGDCTLNGLYLLGHGQHADHHTTIDHARPHGTSRELYKGILNGKSRAVFNGRIIVRKDAQKTDAEQTNKNLLLSRDARVNTTPQLEILADDVKCRHGATIGHLDEDSLFYLRSRGLADQVARTWLMKGFLQDVTGKLHPGKVRDFLDDLITSRLLAFTGVSV